MVSLCIQPHCHLAMPSLSALRVFAANGIGLPFHYVDDEPETLEITALDDSTQNSTFGLQSANDTYKLIGGELVEGSFDPRTGRRSVRAQPMQLSEEVERHHLWRALETSEGTFMTAIEAKVEEDSRSIWWQKLKLNDIIKKEARLQALTKHTVAPKCGSCTWCTGYTLSQDKVWLAAGLLRCLSGPGMPTALLLPCWEPH